MREGTKFLYELKPGEKAFLTEAGAVIAHPENEPFLVVWGAVTTEEVLLDGSTRITQRFPPARP